MILEKYWEWNHNPLHSKVLRRTKHLLILREQMIYYNKNYNLYLRAILMLCFIILYFRINWKCISEMFGKFWWYNNVIDYRDATNLQRVIKLKYCSTERIPYNRAIWVVIKWITKLNPSQLFLFFLRFIYILQRVHYNLSYFLSKDVFQIIVYY